MGYGPLIARKWRALSMGCRRRSRGQQSRRLREPAKVVRECQDAQQDTDCHQVPARKSSEPSVLVPPEPRRRPYSRTVRHRPVVAELEVALTEGDAIGSAPGHAIGRVCRRAASREVHTRRRPSATSMNGASVGQSETLKAVEQWRGSPSASPQGICGQAAAGTAQTG